MNDPNKPLRLVVTGGRDFRPRSNSQVDDIISGAVLRMALARSEIHVDQDLTLKLAQGGAKGADLAAALWARRQKEGVVELSTYEADWGKHGKAAGAIRNREMLDDFKPELVLAIWDGHSRGTHDCIQQAVQRGIPVLIEPYKRVVNTDGELNFSD